MSTYGIDFTEILVNHALEFPSWFVELMESAEPRYCYGLAVDRFLELGGSVNNLQAVYNQQEGESLDEYLGRLCDQVLKDEILASDNGFSDTAAALIRGAPHRWM